MARARTKKQQSSKGRGLFVQVIPLIAIVLVGGVFAIYFIHPGVKLCSDRPSNPPTLSYTIALSIQVVNQNGTKTVFVVPPAIGIPGGAWSTHQYDAYGTDGRYPICTDGPTTSPSQQYQGYNVIRVMSTQQVNYTLRDFFDVWGQPLGRNMTDRTLNSAYLVPRPAYVWQMCIGNPTNPSGLRLGNFTYEALVPDKFITLVYYPTNTSYPGCL